MKIVPSTCIFSGFNNSEYPGAFTPAVEGLIKKLSNPMCLNLFSGSSLIGDERVDMSHENATIKTDVRDFIKNDKRIWDTIILDPPFAHKKEKSFGKWSSSDCLSANVPLRRDIVSYMSMSTSNIIWIDQCSPIIKGFERFHVWLLLPWNSYRTVTVLTQLKRK